MPNGKRTAMAIVPSKKPRLRLCPKMAASFPGTKHCCTQGPFFFFPGSHIPQPRPAAGGTCYHQQPSLDKAIHASSRQLQPSEKATKQSNAVSLSVQDHSPWASDGLNNHHSRPAAVCAALGHSWFLSLKAPRRNSSC